MLDPNDSGSRSADFDLVRGIPGVERIIDGIKHTGGDIATALGQIDCIASRFFFHQAERVFQPGASSTTPSSNTNTSYINTVIDTNGIPQHSNASERRKS